jgi:hypothetical protein
VAYFPPSTTSEDVKRFYDYFYSCYDILISESPSTSFIIAGDFNPTSNGFRPAKSGIANWNKLLRILQEDQTLSIYYLQIYLHFSRPQKFSPQLQRQIMQLSY